MVRKFVLLIFALVFITDHPAYGFVINAPAREPLYAKLTQQAASIRTNLVRMVIGGAKVEDLDFTPPDDIDGSIENKQNFVFDKAGGGAIYPDLMGYTGTDAKWVFTKANNLERLGTDAADIVAFVIDLPAEMCREINDFLGFGMGGNIPELDVVPSLSQNTVFPNDPVLLKVDASPFGCFKDKNGTLYYFHTLIER